MNPLLFTILLATHAPHDPLASLPREIVIAHGATTSLTISPTGSTGPSLSVASDVPSASRDRLKADRVAILPAIGAGVVLTLTRF